MSSIDEFEGWWIMPVLFIIALGGLFLFSFFVNSWDVRDFNNRNAKCQQETHFVGSPITDAKLLQDDNSEYHCYIVVDGKIQEFD